MISLLSCHVNHPPVVDLTNAVCFSFDFWKSTSFKPLHYFSIFWHASQWSHCAQCIMELLNRLFYPGNWSHRCQGVNWDSIHSQPTDRFWIVAANCVGWSGRHQERSRESLCVDLWLYMNDSSEETRVKPLFQRKKEEEQGTSWTFAVELECASAQSLSKVTW